MEDFGNLSFVERTPESNVTLDDQERNLLEQDPEDPEDSIIENIVQEGRRPVIADTNFRQFDYQGSRTSSQINR